VIELPDLYLHQSDQKERVRAALAKHGRVILNAPQGGGKTRMSKWILGAAMNRKPGEKASGRYLWCVHRRGLVDNAVASFGEAPQLPHGTIMSGADTSYGHQIQVASIDSLLSWFIESDKYRSDLTFDLIIFDESHSHVSKLARFLKYHDAKRESLGLHAAYVIGLTATPQAKGLADIYKEIIPGPPTKWLIEQGYLSPFRYFAATQGKLGLLVKRGGEFTKDSVSAAMNGMAGDLVRDWKRFAEGRPTLGFFPRRSHAREAAQELEAAGLRVEYVDGETDDDERRRIFRRLNDHETDYLVNVQVVERGTDIPRIGCVQLCVATNSLVRYRQLIGRGSRRHPAKKDCYILDHGNNVKRMAPYGLFEDDPPWSLDITTKNPGEAGTRPTIECPRCSAIYRGGRCANCGYEPTPRERRAQGLDFDGSELKEFIPEKKPPSVRSAEDLMVSAMYIAGKSGRTWRQCCGIFKGLNEKQGSNYRVPSQVTVGGCQYRMIRYGSRDSNRRVSILYPFTVSRGEHGGDYLVEEAVTSAPY